MSLLRTLRILLAALGLAAALPLAAQTTKVVGSGAVITEFRGTVMVQVGTQPARPFKPGQALAPGTIIQTGKDASAVLVFPDGQICVLGEQSKFRVIEYRYDPREPASNGASLNLIEGSLRLVLGEIGQKNPSAVRVQVGMATLAPLPSPDSRGGTDASVVVQGGPVAVTVQQGSVAVMLPAGSSEQVGSGQGLYIAPDGTLRRGDTGQVIQFLSQLAQGPDMQKQLADLRGFDQKIAQTIITLATVTSAVKDPSAPGATDQVAAAEILNQLESLPAPGAVNQPAASGPSAAGGGSAGTPSTGGGGGGTPCAASCN